MARNSFFDDIVKETGNEYAASVACGIAAGDVTEFIDTGSYILNALLSGSIYGGLPSNKITAFAGESATGKTYFLLSLVKSFLDRHPEAGVLYFESESALTKDMIQSRGIDTNRIHIIPVTTVQEFRHQAIKVLDKYALEDESTRPPLMLCLDSLGMLSTTKEMEDTAAGSETKDMTRASIIKGAFRVLTLKLSKVKVPLLVTNHTYAGIGGLYPTQELGGGAGLKYAASTIVMLSKRKDKDGTDVVGNIIHCKLHKGRITKENKVVDTVLRYDTGLDKYYGLVTLAEKYGIVKKVSTRYELPDGTKVFEKTINGNPEKYLTKDILDKLNECAKKEFLYGQGEAVERTATTEEQPEAEVPEGSAAE